MKRPHVIVAAAVASVIGIATPIGAMLYVSSILAVRTELRHLTFQAERVIARANLSFEEARRALGELAKSDLEPCSAGHIAEMRSLTVATRLVDEIGYFADGEMKCTSWGPIEPGHAKSHIDYVTPDGIGVAIGIWPLVRPSSPMLGLHGKNYNVLVDPARFFDVLVEPGVSLAIASDEGLLIGSANRSNLGFVRTLLARPESGMKGDRLFVVIRAPGWLAVAVEPSANMSEALHDQWTTLLPVGGCAGLYIVGLVVWLSRKRLSLRGELAIAVQKHEFVVHYQPIVELKTRICIGAEALVRWRRPDGTIERPDVFLPLAEESGLIQPITDQVIDAIVRDLGGALAADRSLHIAVNLCAADVKSGRVLDVLERALHDTGIRPEQIWLETTERGFVDIDSARATLTRARARGHAVAIDDFGTGYSSLQYLQGLPMDALKIDKSFVDTIGMQTATSDVTTHIIDMAKALRLHIVAEGVETAAQAEYLVARGVEFGQGWLFAKALPADELIAFLRRSKDQHGRGPDIIQRAAA